MQTNQSKFTTHEVSGFTLIELLVVIVIITILVAILFPVFAAAREKSRQATCQNNMKEIGTALQMYLTDCDESFPYGLRPANATEVAAGQSSSGLPAIYGVSGIWWCQTLAPYVDKVQVYNGGRNFSRTSAFLCPDTASNWSSYTVMSSYAVNDNAMGPNKVYVMPVYNIQGATVSTVPGSMPQISSPSTVAGFVEENRLPFTGAPSLPELMDECQAHYHTTVSSGGDTCTLFTYGRHNNGSDIIYLDGHVKWVPANNLHYDVGDMWGVTTL